MVAPAWPEDSSEGGVLCQEDGARVVVADDLRRDNAVDPVGEDITRFADGMEGLVHMLGQLPAGIGRAHAGVGRLRVDIDIVDHGHIKTVYGPYVSVKIISPQSIWYGIRMVEYRSKALMSG